jgi:hypothetical protein
VTKVEPGRKLALQSAHERVVMFLGLMFTFSVP